MLFMLPINLTVGPSLLEAAGRHSGSKTSNMLSPIHVVHGGGGANSTVGSTVRVLGAVGVHHALNRVVLHVGPGQSMFKGQGG